jgi:hypothetical protein
MSTLLAIELYLQFTEIELSYHELNPKVGKKIQKDKRIIMLKEGFYMGRSNKFGYIGPAYPMEKEENVFRVILMGDSYVEGFQLFEKYHFRKIMEEELNKSSKKEVQVLNFASGGFNFSDMYVYYVNYASMFDPDLVIYVIRPGDLAERTSFVPAPYFYMDNDILKINYDFINSGVYKVYQRYRWFFENSSFIKMTNNIYKLTKLGYLPEIVFGKFYASFYSSKKKNPVNKNNERRAIKNVKKKEIILSEAVKKIFKEMGDSKNAYFVYRARFPDKLNDYIVDSGIKVINLDEMLRGHKKKGGNLNYWKATGKTGHWNHEAHNIIGVYLADKLRPAIH